MKSLSILHLLVIGLALVPDYTNSQKRSSKPVKKLPPRLPKTAKSPANHTTRSSVNKKFGNVQAGKLHATSFIFTAECFNDFELEDGGGILIATPHKRYDMYCDTHVKAMGERYLLELTLHYNDLKFDCSMESLTFTMDYTAATVCSGGGSIMLKGRSLHIQYVRELTEKFGDYMISIISTDQSKEKIESAVGPFYNNFDCGTSVFSQRTARSIITFPSIQTRIVGGENAVMNEFPWMAYLEINTRSGIYSCGGTLISEEHILTAAHCISSDTVSISVTLGALDLNDYNTGQTWISTVFVVHESYDDYLIEQDIALIKLPEKVVFSESIKPICLPTQNIGDMADEMAAITGFGDKRYNGKASDILQVADVVVWDVSSCHKAWMNKFEVEILPTQICALGLETQDSCTGDSGGPLISEKYDQKVLLGLTSYGDRCAVPGMPGVYTKVSKYIGWIDDKQEQM